MNAAYPILFAISGALMLGLFLYGAHERKENARTGRSSPTDNHL